MAQSPQHDYRAAATSAGYLASKIHSRPKVAVLTGTGLGDIAAGLQMEVAIDYRDIPFFPISTVQSHYGRLVVGKMGSRSLLILQGRFHLYEGYSPLEVTFPIRVLQALGVRCLFLTNASGGLNPQFAAGDIMMIEDHINLTGFNPLVGPNDDRWGPRFVGLTQAYSDRLQDLALSASRALTVRFRKGVYAGLTGPSLETPAEMRFLRTIGADAVGFSTVMEAIVAAHAGMRVLGLSVITNMCLPDAPGPADVDAIIAAARSAAPQLGGIIGYMNERFEDEF